MDKKTSALLLKEWRERLVLNDWFINLSYACDPSDMALENCAGECEWETTNKCASVRIKHEKYLETPEYYNFERTLIHELLHIKFGIVWNNVDGAARDLLHQTIEELARALYDAKEKK